MPTIKELEALLKSSEEEMLFWRHEHRDADKRATELEAEIEKALKVNNPCGHTGFESTVCEICGYPDPRKLIAKLEEENQRLRAFWEWSRLADKMTFEQYHWIGKEASHE